MIGLKTGLSGKIIKICTTTLFFKMGLCSATSMESSRRALLNDVAELRPILKNNQNTYHPYGFTPKTAFPKKWFCFNCDKTLLCDYAVSRSILTSLKKIKKCNEFSFFLMLRRFVAVTEWFCRPLFNQWLVTISTPVFPRTRWEP